MTHLVFGDQASPEDTRFLMMMRGKRAMRIVIPTGVEESLLASNTSWSYHVLVGRDL